MKTLAISAKSRASVGKKDSKALRNQGNVPCVLYGGEKQVCFFAHENDFRKLVYTPDVFIVELNVDGDVRRAIMQDIQFHPVTDKILHIDFLEIFEDKEVTVSIPVVLNGLAVGVRNGGVLMFRRRKIITRGLPSSLPDMIDINIEDLNIGQFVYIKDLEAEGCSFLAPDNAVVVGVKTARTVIEEVEEDEDLEDGEDASAADGGSDNNEQTKDAEEPSNDTSASDSE